MQVVVLSGPSGSGKTTIVQRLLDCSPIKLIKCVSATTRASSRGEVEGEDYYFLTPDEFRVRRENGEFLECCEVHGTGNWYGTLKSELQRAKEAGGWALLEIDVQGAQRVLEQYPHGLTISCGRPPMSDGCGPGDRIGRGDSARLKNAQQELESATLYQYQVINDDLQQAVQEITRILILREAEIHAR